MRWAEHIYNNASLITVLLMSKVPVFALSVVRSLQTEWEREQLLQGAHCKSLITSYSPSKHWKVFSSSSRSGCAQTTLDLQFYFNSTQHQTAREPNPLKSAMSNPLLITVNLV